MDVDEEPLNTSNLYYSVRITSPDGLEHDFAIMPNTGLQEPLKQKLEEYQKL